MPRTVRIVTGRTPENAKTAAMQHQQPALGHLIPPGVTPAGGVRHWKSLRFPAPSAGARFSLDSVDHLPWAGPCWTVTLGLLEDIYLGADLEGRAQLYVQSSHEVTFEQ